MNFYSIGAIYKFEMARALRTLGQTVASPVISTCLYFVVFGSAIGSRMVDIDGVAYAAFIIPGLVMMTLLMQSISNASFGIYFPRFSGTIYELLSAPVSHYEILLGYVGAAATKSIVIGFCILMTARFFVDYEIQHPFWMIGFLVMTAITFSLFGFILGILADGFEQLQIVPLMVVTPWRFWGALFIPSICCPRFGRPLLCLIRWFIWSAAFAGVFMVLPMWVWGLAWRRLGAFCWFVSLGSGGYLRLVFG